MCTPKKCEQRMSLQMKNPHCGVRRHVTVATPPPTQCNLQRVISTMFYWIGNTVLGSNMTGTIMWPTVSRQ